MRSDRVERRNEERREGRGGEAGMDGLPRQAGRINEEHTLV